VLRDAASGRYGHSVAGAQERRDATGRLGRRSENLDKACMQHRADRIATALATQFPDGQLRVEDQSRLHAGHAGARPEGETHFHVELISAAFAGQSRLARSRSIHDLLRAEFEGGLHALSLRLLTPAEAAAAGN